MKAVEREAHALAKLLKLARRNAEEAGLRVATLQSSFAEADASLRLLADAVHDEEAAARAAAVVGFKHLAGFLEGAIRKRAALEETKTRLQAEIETAGRDLDAAYAEMKRFEHLTDRLCERAEDQRRKKELADIDAAALSRFLRSEAR